MVWIFRDPQNNNTIVEVPESFDDKLGVDVNRKKMEDAGLELMEDVFDPENGQRLTIPATKLEKAFRGGLVTEKQYESEQAMDAPQGDESIGETIVSHAAQGASMGFADELTAATMSLVDMVKDGEDFGKSYDLYKATLNRRLDQLSEANPGTALTANIAGGLLLGFGGAAAVGSKLPAVEGTTKVLQNIGIGAGTGFVEGVGRSDEDITSVETLKLAIEEAAWGAGAVGVLEGAGKAIKSVFSPKQVREILTESTKPVGEGVTAALEEIPSPDMLKKGVDLSQKKITKITKKLGKPIGDVDYDEMREALPGDARGIGKFLINNKTTNKDYHTLARTKWNALNSEQKEVILGNHTLNQSLYDLSQHKIESAAREFGIKLQDPASVKARSLFQESTYLLRDVDTKLGTAFEPTLNKVTKAGNVVSNMVNKHLSGYTPLKDVSEIVPNKTFNLEDVHSLFRKQKLDPKEFGQQFIGMKEVTKEYKPFVSAMRRHYDIARRYVRAKGFSVGELDDYMNMKTLDPADLHNEMTTRYMKFLDLSETTGVDIDEMKSILSSRKGFEKLGIDKGQARVLDNDLRGLLGISKRLNGGQPVKSFSDIKAATEEALKTHNKLSEGFEMGILQKRTGKIPPEYREFDPFKNILSYTNSAYKSVHLDQPIKELSIQSNALDNLGLGETKDYVRGMIKSLSGSEVGYWDQGVNRIKAHARKMMEEGDSFQKFGAGATQLAVDWMSSMTNFTYGALLGLNPKTAIVNLMQFPIGAATTLPPAYRNKILSKSAKHLFNPPKEGIGVWLRKNNFYSTNERLREIQKGTGQMFESRMGETGMARLMSKATEATMYPFAKGEEVGVYLSMKFGEDLADDIIKGIPEAKKFLRELPPGYKAKLRANPELLQNKKELGEMIGFYIKDSIMLTYDKAHMSQLARDYGGAVRMFSKWPINQASRIADFAFKPDDPAAQRFIKGSSTLLGLAILGNYARTQIEEGTPTEKAMNYFVGDDFVNMVPLGAIGSFTPGMTSPPLQVGIDITKTFGRTVGGDVTPAEGAKQFSGNLHDFFMVAGPIPPVQAAIREINKLRKMADEPTTKDVIQEGVEDLLD